MIYSIFFQRFEFEDEKKLNDDFSSGVVGGHGGVGRVRIGHFPSSDGNGAIILLSHSFRHIFILNLRFFFQLLSTTTDYSSYLYLH